MCVLGPVKDEVYCPTEALVLMLEAASVRCSGH